MFERFFRKQGLELNIGQVSGYIDKEFATQKDELETRLKSYAQEIQDAFRQVEEFVLVLQSKSSQNRYANTVKQKFCEKSIEAISSVKSFSGTNKDLIKVATSSIRTIADLNLKDFRHLHSFREDMTKIAEKVKLLETRVNYANKAVSAASVARVDRIADRIGKISENRASVANIEKLTEDIRQASGILAADISDMQKKMNEMSTDLSRQTVDKIKLRSLELEQHSIGRRIGNEFAGLDRVMKKFLYYGDLTKDESHMMQGYIKDPGPTFMSDSSNVISSILEKLYSYRDRKTIEMDEPKHEKIKDLIRHMKVLKELREKYGQIEQEKAQLEIDYESRTDPVLKEIKSLRLQAAEKQRELNSMQARMQSLVAEKQVMERETSSILATLESELSELLNRSVKIVQ